MGHSRSGEIQVYYSFLLSWVIISYYYCAIGILLVYDITNRGSFESLNKWVEEISSYANKKIQLIIVANKSDII